MNVWGKKGNNMAKKAYKLKKEGDFYVAPSGMTKAGYVGKIKTMDKEAAKQVIKSRKTLVLKRKYPEIRESMRNPEVKKNMDKIKEEEYSQELKKNYPPKTITRKNISLSLKDTNKYQVIYANAQHYLYDGYAVETMDIGDGKYALYVSDYKVRR